MKLSDAIRTSYRLGVCCPEYMALPTLGATTTPPRLGLANAVAQTAPRLSRMRKSTPRLVRKIGRSNRSQRWSASRTRLAMAFKLHPLLGPSAWRSAFLRKLSPRSHRSSRNTDYACLFSPACDAARSWNASKLTNTATQSQANQSPVRA
jgi:hypothetical protein